MKTCEAAATPEAKAAMDSGVKAFCRLTDVIASEGILQGLVGVPLGERQGDGRRELSLGGRGGHRKSLQRPQDGGKGALQGEPEDAGQEGEDEEEEGEKQEDQ